MGELVGKDVTQVAIQYGPPVASYDLPDGRKAFQWRMDTAMMMPTTTTVTGYGNTATAYTTGGGISTSTCFYTLYAVPNAAKSFTVTGFEPPNAFCE